MRGGWVEELPMHIDIHRHLLLGDDPGDLALVPARADFESWIDARLGAESSETRDVVLPPSIYAMPEGLADTRRLNDLVAAAAARIGAIAAFATVEPQQGDTSLEEIDRIAKDLKMVGLAWRHRLQGVYADVPVMHRFVARAAEHGLTLMLHAGGGENEALFRVWALAEAFPQSRFIVVGALSDYDQRRQIIASPSRAPNIAYEMSRMSFHADFRPLTETLGIERLLYGSGRPLGPSAAAELADVGLCLDGAKLTDEQRDLVMRGNAARLLGLEKGGQS
jgi:predicted TIM-barrel fold metal-dependent hydrolase